MPFGAMWVRPRSEIPRRRPRATSHKLAVTMSLKEDALARRRRIEKSVEQMMINPVDPADAAPDSSQLDRLAAAYGTILECIGEDTARSGLQDTPMRAAKANEPRNSRQKKRARRTRRVPVPNSAFRRRRR